VRLLTQPDLVALGASAFVLMVQVEHVAAALGQTGPAGDAHTSESSPSATRTTRAQ